MLPCTDRGGKARSSVPCGTLSALHLRGSRFSQSQASELARASYPRPETSWNASRIELALSQNHLWQRASNYTKDSTYTRHHTTLKQSAEVSLMTSKQERFFKSLGISCRCSQDRLLEPNIATENRDEPGMPGMQCLTLVC